MSLTHFPSAGPAVAPPPIQLGRSAIGRSYPCRLPPRVYASLVTAVAAGGHPRRAVTVHCGAVTTTSGDDGGRALGVLAGAMLAGGRPKWGTNEGREQALARSVLGWLEAVV